MGTVKNKLNPRQRRKIRVRKRVTGSEVRPRLSIFRSAKHIYAQVIDDVAGTTLASVSTLGKTGVGDEGDKTAQAKRVGKMVAEMCVAKSITQVVFDRNGFRYHGRVQAVADAAREGGLQF